MRILFVLCLSAILASFSACGDRAVANKAAAAAPVVQVKELTMDDYFAQLQKDAGLGKAEAQFRLGWIYLHGEGYTGVVFIRDIPKDVNKAFGLYQNAAEQGHVSAQYNLGMLYKLGLGLRADDEKAFSWLQKSASQGNDLAQYNLGGLYAEGVGVKRNLTFAGAWLALAAAQGNEKAKKSYSDIDTKLTPAQRTEVQRLVGIWKMGDVI